MARTYKKKQFKIKKRTKKGVCRIIDSGKNCNTVVLSRGVCGGHYGFFRKWGLIKFFEECKNKKFVDSKYSINKNAKKTLCHVIENGAKCQLDIHARHCCHRHYAIFAKFKLLNKFGSTSNQALKTFTKKKRIVKGVCHVIENGKGCHGTVVIKGLCRKHYQKFSRQDDKKKSD